MWLLDFCFEQLSEIQKDKSSSKDTFTEHCHLASQITIFVEGNCMTVTIVEHYVLKYGYCVPV